jgi:hypothetical protein
MNESKSKIYELNGAEQVILEDKVKTLRKICADKVHRQVTIDKYTRELKGLRGRQKSITDDMAKLFGLTRVQVIGKIIAENRRLTNGN